MIARSSEELSRETDNILEVPRPALLLMPILDKTPTEGDAAV